MRTIHNLSENFSDGLLFPKGTSAERGNPEAGYFRYNTETKGIEVYDGTSWSSMDNTPSYVTDGLVLNLDAGNLNSYDGSGNTWSDLAQDGNDFTTLSNFVTASPNYFDTDYNNVTESVSNIVVSNALGLSLEIWLNVNNWTASGGTSASYSTIIDGFYTGGTGTKFILRRDSSGNLFTNIAGVSATKSSYNTINQWVNLTATYDGSTVELYENGVNIASASNSGGNVSFDKSVELGRASDGSEWLNAKINSVRIYNKGLTSSEVTQNFNAKKSIFGL